MIVTFIITTLLNVVKTVMGILPTVPAMPQPVIDAGNWVISTIIGMVSLLTMLYGTTLFAALIVVGLALLNFTWIYHTIMWIVRKIPMVNIK